VYQAFLDAEVNEDQISENFTRVLVVGCLNLTGSRTYMKVLTRFHDKKHNGFDNTNPGSHTDMKLLEHIHDKKHNGFDNTNPGSHTDMKLLEHIHDKKHNGFDNTNPGSHTDMKLLEHIHDKKHNGFDNTNPVLDLSLEAMDINNGWMHPTVPLCIHTSKGIGDSEQLGQIKTFLAERNSLCTSSSWFATWQEELKTGGNMSWKSFEDLNDARVHVVWILYSLSERRHFGQLLHLKDALEPYGVPVQILIVKDTDDVDCHGQQLGKNLLYKRGFLFPDVLTLQEYLITGLDWSSGEVGKAEDSQVALFDKALWAPQGALRDNTMELKQLDNKALWASAEVIKTIANIQKTAQVINDVASILDKRGVNIWIKALMRLQGHHTSAWCGTFTVKCLCKIWEVPKTMETTIWQKLASWELDETGESRLDGTMSKCQLQEGPTSLTLNDGKYLQFSTRVAGVILYCKAFHLTGWSKIDYSQEFDSFYAAYRHWFEEFLKRFNFGISSKILRTLFPSSDTAAGTLKQQVQTSLEKLFVEILNH
jgi:hypothetical protein